jgi:hypothetical protein
MNNSFSNIDPVKLLSFMQSLTKDNIEQVISEIRSGDIDRSMQDKIIDLIRNALENKLLAQSAGLL